MDFHSENEWNQILKEITDVKEDPILWLILIKK